jgi:hypothetical protein
MKLVVDNHSLKGQFATEYVLAIGRVRFSMVQGLRMPVEEYLKTLHIQLQPLAVTSLD